VTRIAGGEKGGVMMNEFPPKYREVMGLASGSDVPLMSVSEYLELLAGLGIVTNDYPALPPLFQGRIGERMEPGDGQQRPARVVEEFKQEDHPVHMDGGSCPRYWRSRKRHEQRRIAQSGLSRSADTMT
jgi:hypothetical protein